MTYSANVYRVLIASPSDVASERLAIPEVISAWNAIHSVDFNAVLLPVRWETHATPEMGDRPQSIINKRLVQESDILIAVFWTRLGTPTGKAASGSVEEIREFRSRGKPALLYFSNAPVIANSVDLKQFESLKEFKESCFKEGLVACYDSLDDFREQLHRHLVDTVRRLEAPRERWNMADALEIPTPKQELERLILKYEIFLRRLEAEWTAEHASSPTNLEGGKYIFQKASDALLDYRAQPLIALYPELERTLDDILKQVRVLQNHRLTFGASYQEFWQAGDDIFAKIKSIPHMWRTLLPPSTEFEVQFLHPENNSTFDARVSPRCTGRHALNGLLVGNEEGPFVKSPPPGCVYELFIKRTQQIIGSDTTFEEAGVVSGDVVIVRSTMA